MKHIGSWWKFNLSMQCARVKLGPLNGWTWIGKRVSLSFRDIFLIPMNPFQEGNHKRVEIQGPTIICPWFQEQLNFFGKFLGPSEKRPIFSGGRGVNLWRKTP